MFCAICGSERPPYWFEGKWVERYPSKGWQVLCLPCAKETPDKVSREEFEARYWLDKNGKCNAETVPLTTRKEFYSDYLASMDTLESYIESTVSEL